METLVLVKQASAKVKSKKGLLHLGLGLTFALIYMRGLHIPLMHNDSAHHANIALHMYNTGDYVTLVDRGSDYLDKPHFLFWSAALSFYLFGVSAFSFKLTSFLFGLLTLYATFNLARIFYNSRVATLAIVILVSSYAFMLSFNDVRMDAILTGAFTFSIWQLILLCRSTHWSHVLLSALGLAIGFSTKGAIGLVIPAIAVIVYLLQLKSLRRIFSFPFILASVCTFMFMLPVLYCFYTQFDLHPEKVIHGATGNSGIKFILFGQSLQRLSGDGQMPTGSDPFFYLHTFLWAFLPWSIVAVISWFDRLVSIFKDGFFSEKKEVVTFMTITMSFVLLSIVASKLPHYINITLPLISILTASFLLQVSERTARKLKIMQRVIAAVILIPAMILLLFVFEVPSTSILIGSVVLLSICVFLLSYDWGTELERIMVATIPCSLLLFFVLNFHFYPNLVHYQAGSRLAQTISQHKIPTSSLYYLEGFGTCNDLDFSLTRNIPFIDVTELLNKNLSCYIVTDKEGLDHLRATTKKQIVLSEATNFRVSKLSLKFLVPVTRSSVLSKMYLVRIN
jgi:4-amino-4-deoxy-L-arabinose transferase-like glycosyltransferase